MKQETAKLLQGVQQLPLLAIDDEGVGQMKKRVYARMRQWKFRGNMTNEDKEKARATARNRMRKVRKKMANQKGFPVPLL